MYRLPTIANVIIFVILASIFELVLNSRLPEAASISVLMVVVINFILTTYFIKSNYLEIKKTIVDDDGKWLNIWKLAILLFIFTLTVAFIFLLYRAAGTLQHGKGIIYFLSISTIIIVDLCLVTFKQILFLFKQHQLPYGDFG